MSKHSREVTTAVEIDLQEADLDDVSIEEELKEVKPRRTILSTALQILNFFRMLCGLVVDATIFQYVILILIVTNSLMMAIGTYTFVTENEEISEQFARADDVFLIIFTVELILQFIYRGFSLFLNGVESNMIWS